MHSPDALDNQLNLDAYFQRIGYGGDRAPTLANLRTIHQCHTQAIAFENLNPLLKLPVLLDLPTLQQKLVFDQRGGYCFEQNSLFSAILQQLGFTVVPLAARVRWRVPADVMTTRTHMVLLVTIADQSYLADVGFGGGTLPQPIPLIPNQEFATSHERFRLTWADGLYTLLVQLNATEATWEPLYRFDLQPQVAIDYEVKNWYVSTYPDSIFVNSLMMAKVGKNCRYALRDRHFTIYYLDGKKVERQVNSIDEFRQVLADPFGICVPDHPNLDNVLQRSLEM